MFQKMKRALKSLSLPRTPRRPSALAMQHFKPAFEPLEERRLLAVDVIGPHEFWTHANAQNNDYVGYVEYFDMEPATPTYSVTSDTSNGAFSLNSSTGLITIADYTKLTSGATYTVGVNIEQADAQEGDTNVTIHVATAAQTVYITDHYAGTRSGIDGCYTNPYVTVHTLGSSEGAD